jgi:hypothetical protein
VKVNVELECTPEEMRRLMGLPDLTPIHDRYVAMMNDAVSGQAIKPEALEAMMRSWAPMGEAGLAMWRQLIEGTPKT